MPQKEQIDRSGGHPYLQECPLALPDNVVLLVKVGEPILGGREARRRCKASAKRRDGLVCIPHIARL